MYWAVYHEVDKGFVGRVAARASWCVSALDAVEMMCQWYVAGYDLRDKASLLA